MSVVYLPHVNAFTDWRARTWAADVLAEHNVRDDVIRLLLRRCTWTVKDWTSVNGGGFTHWTEPPEHIWIELFTRQPEACIHEAAHAYRVAVLTTHRETWETLAGQLVLAFLAESEMPPGDFPVIRKLCRDYRWGWAPGRSMWMPEEGRWNDSEIWAGLASGSMGDLSLYPPRLRTLYAQFYGERR